MQLSEVQERFKTTLLDDPKVLENLDPAFSDLFNEGDIPLSDRLNVYRNNVVRSITNGVIDHYPIIHKLVGEDFLRGMARMFVIQDPPTQGCLNMYGGKFPEFIAEFELAKSMPYLPDVARLEFAMNEAYYARDDKPLAAEELASIAEADLEILQLKLRDSIRLIASQFPLDEIREFVLNDTKDSQETFNIGTGSVKLMIFRPDLEVQIARLEEAEFALLENLMQGKSLGEAVEDIIKRYDGFYFQGFLQKHVALETFASLEANA